MPQRPPSRNSDTGSASPSEERPPSPPPPPRGPSSGTPPGVLRVVRYGTPTHPLPRAQSAGPLPPTGPAQTERPGYNTLPRRLQQLPSSSCRSPAAAGCPLEAALKLGLPSAAAPPQEEQEEAGLEEEELLPSPPLRLPRPPPRHPDSTRSLCNAGLCRSSSPTSSPTWSTTSAPTRRSLLLLLLSSPPPPPHLPPSPRRRRRLACRYSLTSWRTWRPLKRKSVTRHGLLTSSRLLSVAAAKAEPTATMDDMALLPLPPPELLQVQQGIRGHAHTLSHHHGHSQSARHTNISGYATLRRGPLPRNSGSVNPRPSRKADRYSKKRANPLPPQRVIL
ncbi:hypothetical protein CRUP_017097 [Coryphaenoides rupestris]|nr:hypothetical protein CRUP_017097 [Coryphaenoides rupestris]